MLLKKDFRFATVTCGAAGVASAATATPVLFCGGLLELSGTVGEVGEVRVEEARLLGSIAVSELDGAGEVACG